MKTVAMCYERVIVGSLMVARLAHPRSFQVTLRGMLVMHRSTLVLHGYFVMMCMVVILVSHTLPLMSE